MEAVPYETRKLIDALTPEQHAQFLKQCQIQCSDANCRMYRDGWEHYCAIVRDEIRIFYSTFINKPNESESTDKQITP